jgi:putative membrane protein
MFAAQWLYQDKELEDVFENVGETAKVPLTLFSFERKKVKDGNAHFIIPCIHYGPFGNLGGSEFTNLIANAMTNEYGGTTFVFHGTATHDLNPISSEELSKVMGAVKDCMDSAKYAACKIDFTRGQEKECFAETIRFGSDAAFVSVSRAPLVTEDINFGLGSLLASEAEKNVKIAGIADQHNAETGEVTSFEPGSMVGFNYLEAVKKTLEDAKTAKAPKENFELGVAKRSIDSPFVGKAGLKVAVFSTKPMVAVIVLDSNGMTPEFRERLIDEAKKVGSTVKNCTPSFSLPIRIRSTLCAVCLTLFAKTKEL